MKNRKKAKGDFTVAKNKTSPDAPAPLVYTISDEKKQKALNPPIDNNVIDEKHGYKISDPFRPLENLDAPETSAWVDAQNKKFSDYISTQNTTIDQTAAFMEDAMNYVRSSMPARYGSKYFSTLQDGLAPQPIYQVQDSPDGEARTLFDPNTLSKDGTASLSGTYPSPDGKLVAYLVSQAGSDM